jgi:hypothetical protein
VAKKKSKGYRTEIYFVRGKMKKRKIPLIDGLEVEEFIRRNADDVFLLQNGYYEILHERESKRNAPGDLGAAKKPASDNDRCSTTNCEELPF